MFLRFAIQLLALFGCNGDEADVITPTPGEWAVTFDRRWGGDCRLDDMSTQRVVAERWDLEPRNNDFTFVRPDGLIACTLAGADFDCSLGTFDVDYGPYGLQGREVVHTTVTGTFSSSDALTAEYAIAASCDGPDCAIIGTGYGDAFTYPCTARAGLVGAVEE